MGTNGTDIITEPRLEEDILRIQKVDHSQALGSLDHTPVRKRAFSGADAPQPLEDFALAPLVDRIAYDIARGLVVAVKELETHIATETRKVGDAVDRRLDTFQSNLEDLSKFVGDQRSTNNAVQGQLQDLENGLRESNAREAADVEALRKDAREFSESVVQRVDASTASLQEADARQAAELIVLQNDTKVFSQSVSERIDGLCKELGVHQEDIAAVKSTLSTFSSRVDGFLERLDRQADTVRSMCTAYSQRETELEQLVDGLARLRAFPTPLPANGL